MAPDPHTDSFPSLKRAYLPIAAIKKTNKQTNNQSNNKDTKNDENKKQRKTLKIGYGFYLKFSEHKLRYFFTTYLFKMTSF